MVKEEEEEEREEGNGGSNDEELKTTSDDGETIKVNNECKENPKCMADLNDFVELGKSGEQGYFCALCGKSSGRKYNLINHIESFHFPGMFVHKCPTCGNHSKTRAALDVHKGIHKKKV